MGYGDDIMVTGEINFLLKNNPETKFITGDGSKIPFRFHLRFIERVYFSR